MNSLVIAKLHGPQVEGEVEHPKQEPWQRRAARKRTAWRSERRYWRKTEADSRRGHTNRSGGYRHQNIHSNGDGGGESSPNAHAVHNEDAQTTQRPRRQRRRHLKSGGRIPSQQWRGTKTSERGPTFNPLLPEDFQNHTAGKDGDAKEGDGDPPKRGAAP